MRSTAGTPARRNGVWSSRMPWASPVNGCARAGLAAGRSRVREEAVQARVGVGLARDVKIAVPDHVEEHHRPDLAERRAALAAPTARVLDELIAPPVAGSRERGAAGRFLGVEQDEVDRGPFEARRQVPRQLQHDGHAGGPVVGADEPRDVLGVVVSAEYHVAGEPARDPGDDVAVRALDRDVANPGRTQALDDEPDLAPGARGPRRPRADRDLGAEVTEGALGVEPRGGGRRSQRSRRHLTAARAARGREAGRCRDGRQQKDIASGTWPYGRLG